MSEDDDDLVLGFLFSLFLSLPSISSPSISFSSESVHFSLLVVHHYLLLPPPSFSRPPLPFILLSLRSAPTLGFCFPLSSHAI